jgi:hypothetical protein
MIPTAVWIVLVGLAFFGGATAMAIRIDYLEHRDDPPPPPLDEEHPDSYGE